MDEKQVVKKQISQQESDLDENIRILKKKKEKLKLEAEIKVLESKK